MNLLLFTTLALIFTAVVLGAAVLTVWDNYAEPPPQEPDHDHHTHTPRTPRRH